MQEVARETRSLCVCSCAQVGVRTIQGRSVRLRGGERWIGLKVFNHHADTMQMQRFREGATLGRRFRAGGAAYLDDVF